MNTQTLVSNIRYRFNHLESKKYLEEKYSNQLLLAHSGGLWKITPEFLSMLKNLENGIILIDIYGAPCKVNSTILYTDALKLYNSVMSEWFDEYNNLSKFR